MCTFFVSLSPTLGNRNGICASGMIDDAGASAYHAYSIAFFDRTGNLIACGNDVQDTWGLLLSRKSVTCDLPIPVGADQLVQTYKVAYYESNRPIGKTQRMQARPEVGKKSDDRRIARAGASSLPQVGQGIWRAATMNGLCTPRKTDDCLEKHVPSVHLGDTLAVRADCRFVITKDNELQAWACFHNTSETRAFTDVYLAFFDNDDNLMACTHIAATTEPRATFPTATIVTAGGKCQISAAFTAASAVPIPLGYEQNIVSYKITAYESERPVGEHRRALEQESR